MPTRTQNGLTEATIDLRVQAVLEDILRDLALDARYPETIACRLQSAGARGQRQLPTSCPMWAYLTGELHSRGISQGELVVLAQWDRATVHRGGEKGPLLAMVEWPPVILDFVTRFDDYGCYGFLTEAP